jgi:hypothetical protein
MVAGSFIAASGGSCYRARMRLATCIAAALLAAASPALATSTILCRSTVSPTDGPQLSLVVGSGEAGGIMLARFALGDERFTTGEGPAAPVIAQTWIDRYALKLDIADANADSRIVRLDTRRRRGSDYLGILIHNGRTWRVRCSEEG